MSKHYAVKEGRQPGIYTTWDEAKAQVEKFPGAVFKSFKFLEDAEEYMGLKKSNPSPVIESVPLVFQEEEKAVNTLTPPTSTDYVEKSVEAYVDGSYDEKAGKYSFGAAIIEEGEVIETLQRAGNNPKYLESHQIAGEVFGCLHAIQWALDKGYDRITIYYDYLGIENWATHEWKAKKPVSKDYVEHFNKMNTLIDVSFVKVKAHSGNLFNELADQLAKEALDYCVF